MQVGQPFSWKRNSYSCFSEEKATQAQGASRAMNGFCAPIPLRVDLSIEFP